MFKFCFSVEDNEDSNEEYIHKRDVTWNESKEIIPNDDSTLIADMLESTNVNIVTSCGVEIKYLSSDHVLQVLQKRQSCGDFTILKAEQNHSDLLPGIYEGGLKIWECTYDLLNYINDSNLIFEGKKILDLGCGAGIVGILSLMKGAVCYFQDYNADVMQYITIPNVLINAKRCISSCKFYSGDWQSFSGLLESNIDEDEKFDFMFTSETIYNTENYTKLHHVFEKLLKRTGTIFLAAKTFYFGVGGGISLFQDFLDQHKIFKYSSCWKYEEGIKREILKLEFNT